MHLATTVTAMCGGSSGILAEVRHIFSRTTASTTPDGLCARPRARAPCCCLCDRRPRRPTCTARLLRVPGMLVQLCRATCSGAIAFIAIEPMNHAESVLLYCSGRPRKAVVRLLRLQEHGTLMCAGQRHRMAAPAVHGGNARARIVREPL